MTATVNDLAADRAAREVWAALPIREAYPVGSKWTHTSYGTDVFEVVGYGADERYLRIRGMDGITNEWIRGALDSFGNPVGEISPVPYAPAIGDRVKVTRDDDSPEQVGKSATVLEVRDNNTLGSLRVKYDEGSLSHTSDYGWWVQAVEPLSDATGAPVGTASTPEASEPTPAPFEPVRGDRVRVTELPDGGYGAPAAFVVGAVGTFEQVDPYDANRHYYVTLDDGGRAWAKNVAPFLPETPEEFTAALEAAKASVVSDDLIRAAKREGREEANRTFEEWKRSANETAIAYANNNSLCSEFDRCMVEIGMEPRDTYTREWSVEVTYSFYVEARTEEEAQERAEERIHDGYESGSFEIEEN